LVEFALILPLLFLLVINVVNFGGLLFAWIAVSNAARAGADYMVMGGASVGGPVLTTGSNVLDLVKKDLHNLPNNASDGAVSICACTKTYASKFGSPAVTCTSVATCAVPADTESSTLYGDGRVDVYYTYTPFFSGLKVFGVRLTVPPTTIHRQALARIIQ